MTCFAFTPADLKQKKPKVAIVCQHEQGTFEVWLGDSHRKFQPEDIEHLRGEKRVENCRLSQGQPGIDSIIENTLFNTPDFDHSDKLIKQTEKKRSNSSSPAGRH